MRFDASLYPPELRLFHLPEGRKKAPLYASYWEVAVPATEFERGDHNIGVSTEKLLVPDIDFHKGGQDSMDALEMAHEPLPRTYTVRTPKGGRHIYFKAPYDIACSVERIGKGIDIRGHHGYVVGAGSVTVESEDSAAGEYVVEVDAPIADAPQWLVDLCQRPKERDPGASVPLVEMDSPQAIERGRAFLKSRDPAILKAKGDDWTYKTAAAVMDFGVSPEMTLELMSGEWNDRCSPPWPPEELEQKVRNATRYRKTQIGSSDATAEFDKWKAPSQSRFRLVPRDEYRNEPPPKWLFDQLLPDKGLALLIGHSQAMKSFIALDFAQAVASGRAAFGSHIPTETGAAVYVAGEGLPGVKSLRIPALEQARGVDLGKVPFFLVQEMPQACADADVTELANEIAHAVDATPVRLIVIDTLARAMVGVDENDAAKMGVAIARAQMLAKRFDCLAMLVHHLPKSADGNDANPRGSGTLDGAADAKLLATQVTGQLATKLTNRKIKDGETGYTVSLKADVVWVSHDSAGKPVSSLVLNSTTPEALATTRNELAIGVAAALEALALDGLKTVKSHQLARQMLRNEDLEFPAEGAPLTKEQEKQVSARSEKLRLAANGDRLRHLCRKESDSTTAPWIWELPRE